MLCHLLDFTNYNISVDRLKILCAANNLLCLQAAAHILDRRLSVSSWLQQEGPPSWWFLALNLGVRAHCLAAWVFANPHFSAWPAHTVTATTQLLRQPQQEPLVWMICLNRHQELRPVLNHWHCFPKGKEVNKGRARWLPLCSCSIRVAMPQCYQSYIPRTLKLFSPLHHALFSINFCSHSLGHKVRITLGIGRVRMLIRDMHKLFTTVNYISYL